MTLDEWWEWQKWRLRMNPTTKKFHPEWAKAYLNKT
jgi:hypothetical protein